MTRLPADHPAIRDVFNTSNNTQALPVTRQQAKQGEKASQLGTKRKSPRSASEADVLKSVISYLETRGAVVIRVNSGMQVLTDEHGKRRVFKGAAAGTSDIIAIWRGVPLAVECKYGKNTTTPLQNAFLERWEAAGGVGIVAYGIDDVERALHDIEQQQERQQAMPRGVAAATGGAYEVG